jgi:hypothetical protein
MIKKVKLDAVQVNTPDSLHEKPTVFALEQGLDVVVPKPLSDTIKSAHHMIQAARKTGRLVGVDFHKRDDPRMKEATARYRSGAYGKFQLAVWYMLDKLLVADPNHEPRFFASPDFASKNSPISFLTVHMADAMVTAKRLIEVAPQKRESAPLGIIVKRSASTPGNASDLAFALMQEQLEATGADLLYELKRNEPKIEARAKSALQNPAVQAKISPALRIALDLEAAPDCASRLRLLPRATHLGDMRSVAILAPLARGSKTGCGKWKNRPCVPTCKNEAKEYMDAVKAIQARSAHTEL